jgi:phosphatidylserine decarboxylase
VRISIFLSLMNVHVNRAPMTGTVLFAQYFPGERNFTFLEKSSDLNQHSEIVIENDRLRILVNQVVGPIARRVLFWCKPGQRLQAGQRLGIMKFGSRLDIYLPADEVKEILVKPGQMVTAGETAIASLNPRAADIQPLSPLAELTVKAASEAATASAAMPTVIPAVETNATGKQAP